MTDRIRLLAAIVLATTLVACGDAAEASDSAAGAAPSERDTPGAAAAEPVATPSRTARPTPSPTPTVPPAECSPEEGAEGTACQIVLATANIFGAGLDEPPAPGGGGAGTLPPVWPVPAGATAMIVVGAPGLVVPISGRSAPNGAGGDMVGETRVTAAGSISGIANRDNAMFLVGVFLTDAPPSGDPPPLLDFSDGEDFGELAPEIAQTFFIGDGAGRTYIVPSGATRLFLGFADAFFFKGDPGWYRNNTGQLAVTVQFSAE